MGPRASKILKTTDSIRLLFVFAMSLSLVGISGQLAGDANVFPHVNLALANPAPATNWIPAGPAMDTEKASIFTTTDAELASLITSGGGKAGSIDLTDEALTPILVQCFQTGSGCPAGVDFTNFSVTSPIPEHGYYELQFDLSNNFWGVPFNFGNDATCTAGSVSYSLTLSDPRTSSTTSLTTPCQGVSIRQGIAHLLDKNLFAATAINCAGRCVALDNPVPLGEGLPTPNSCAWDTLFPSTLQVGPCEVGPDPTTGQAGGVSYHFAAATSCGVSGGCSSTPLFPWEPGLGTPDFCAAADHFIAAGLATGKDPNTCALTGIAPSVTQHTVDIFTRTATTDPRTNLGNSLFDEICALFTGVFQNSNTAQCNGAVATPTSITSGPYITQSGSGAITAFPGYSTSKTSTIKNDWWIFTGAFIGVFPFDSSLYGIYNSIFASNNGPNTGTFGVGDVPPCSSASVPTSAASDYMYNCIPLYDQLSNAMEFAQCLSSANSPMPGQTSPTFGNCNGGATAGNCNLSSNPCAAVSAGYQAENLFGQQVSTIPVFTFNDQFGYLADMANVVSSVGAGAVPLYNFGLANFHTWLDAHTNTPATSGTQFADCPAAGPTLLGTTGSTISGDCFRQGFAADTNSVNPYDAITSWDFNIIGNIYDSLLSLNPMGNSQLIGWMTTGLPGPPLSEPQLGYTPPAGTVATYRFTLRKDLAWQDGTALTSWDVKFSFLTLQATRAFQSFGLSDVLDVHVLSPRVFDVNLNATGPFTLFDIGSPTIIPGHLWSAAGTSAWNSALSACAISSAPNSCFLTACPSCNTVSSTMSAPKFDPIAAGILVGSSMFECAPVSGLPNPSGATIGGGCSSTGTENPGVGGYYQLTRYGAGTTPGTAVPSSKYFRSSGTLAVYIWSGNNGQSTHDFINTSTAAFCFLKIVGTAGCTQWQEGIVNPVASPGAPVGFIQVSAITSYMGVQWTGPFNWLPGIPYGCCPFTANPPTGIAALPLTLYEGLSTGNTGNPFSLGTPQVMLPAATEGCAAAYPMGGYDC
jgi:hypothetical protein